MTMLFFMQCDRWCYLVIGCFNWKIGAFQHSVGKLSLQLLSHIFIEIHIHSWISHFYRFLFILVYFHFLWRMLFHSFCYFKRALFTSEHYPEFSSLFLCSQHYRLKYTKRNGLDILHFRKQVHHGTFFTE